MGFTCNCGVRKKRCRYRSLVVKTFNKINAWKTKKDMPKGNIKWNL
jgi:hypothetical protein